MSLHRPLRHLCPTLFADYVLENGTLRNCSGDDNNVAFFNGMIQFAQDEGSVEMGVLVTTHARQKFKI